MGAGPNFLFAAPALTKAAGWASIFAMTSSLRALFWAFAGLWIASSSGAATAPPERVINEAQNRQTVTLARTATLTLRLQANGTTGYEWKIVALPRNLKLVSSAYEASPQASDAPRIAGGGGAQRFTFKAVGVGRGTMRLAYRQAWNPNARPDQTFQVSIVTR